MLGSRERAGSSQRPVTRGKAGRNGSSRKWMSGSVSFACLFLKLNSHLPPDREGLAATGWGGGCAGRVETDLGVVGAGGAVSHFQTELGGASQGPDPTKSARVVLGQVTSLEPEQLISNPDRA